MKLQALCLIILLGSISYSCKKVEACFEAGTSSVMIGESISFTDCSEKAVKHEYDFGYTESNIWFLGTEDRQTSKSANPTHKFTDAGTMTVTLTVLDKKDNEASTTQTVTINCVSASDLAGTTWVESNGSMEWTFTNDSIYFSGLYTDEAPYSMTSSCEVSISGSSPYTGLYEVNEFTDKFVLIIDEFWEEQYVLVKKI